MRLETFVFLEESEEDIAVSPLALAMALDSIEKYLCQRKNLFVRCLRQKVYFLCPND